MAENVPKTTVFTLNPAVIYSVNSFCRPTKPSAAMIPPKPACQTFTGLLGTPQ
jgi:hypothetical protein